MATGIKDKVAIIGMGCTRFGERWDKGAEELMVEAFEECLIDAGIEKKQIEAAWFGTCMEEVSVGKSAHTAFHDPSAAVHPGNAGGKLLRDRNRSLSGRLLRRGVRGLRHLPGAGG